jgi:putative ATPase
MFDQNKHQPLSDKLRPTSIQEIVGQNHLTGKDGILTKIITSNKIPSLILWGNAGCGKTTIAKILAKTAGLHFEMISATASGTAELKKVFENGAKRKKDGFGTILMVDEIHHFNRLQQDLFLPHIEDGTIILIGATTENPSFELNSALLSRCRVITLKPLDEQALEALLIKAEKDFGGILPLTKDAREELISISGGDGRYLLNLCEELFSHLGDKILSVENLLELFVRRSGNYDKRGDGHYGLISAFHKSLRGSDVNASLYYLARMLTSGENPYYVLRRLVRFASEDIGLADPNAILQALAAKEAYDFLGGPEGELAIAAAVIYCATAPKSNAAYMAYKQVAIDAKKYNSLNPPKHILNSPTKMMKKQGFGDGYIYDPNTKNSFSGQEYFPDEMLKNRPEYYIPNQRGFEREIEKRLQYWAKLKKENE